RAHANRKHRVPGGWGQFPERSMEATLLAALFGLIALPSVIDQDIEASMCGQNVIEHSTHLLVITGIAAQRNTETTSLSYQGGWCANGSWQWRGCTLGMLSASGHIDGRASCTQGVGNTFTNPATGTG